MPGLKQMDSKLYFTNYGHFESLAYFLDEINSSGFMIGSEAFKQINICLDL